MIFNLNNNNKKTYGNENDLDLYVHQSLFRFSNKNNATFVMLVINCKTVN